MIVIISPKIISLLSIFMEIEAITIYPFIIFRKEPSEIVKNHEMIHIEQQKELLIIGFYILYVAFYLYNLITMGKEIAYESIPFEVESYKNEGKEKYLVSRKHFAWIEYI